MSDLLPSGTSSCSRLLSSVSSSFRSLRQSSTSSITPFDALWQPFSGLKRPRNEPKRAALKGFHPPFRPPHQQDEEGHVAPAPARGLRIPLVDHKGLPSTFSHQIGWVLPSSSFTFMAFHHTFWHCLKVFMAFYAFFKGPSALVEVPHMLSSALETSAHTEVPAKALKVTSTGQLLEVISSNRIKFIYHFNLNTHVCTCTYIMTTSEIPLRSLTGHISLKAVISDYFCVSSNM